MLYFIIAFIVFILFLYFQRDKRASVKYLLATGLLYTLAIISMILYLSRDFLYYNVIGQYFSLPEAVWKRLMLAPLSKAGILRALNLFTLATIYMGCRFSLTYCTRTNQKKITFLTHVLFWFFLVEFPLYDPLLEKLLYVLLHPSVFDSGQYETFLKVIHIITLSCNNGIVLLSILNLFRRNRQIYVFPYFKYFALGETASYTLIMISFLFLFGQLPVHAVRYSQFSGYTAYISLPLYHRTEIYYLFPYYLLAATLMMGTSIILLTVFSSRVNAADFSISSRIDAANTTSKAFCHYMKNELLAIQAQMQLLEIAPESREDLTDIQKRCQNLYKRLDVMHRSTKQSVLKLESTDLEALLRQILERMAADLSDIQIMVQTTDELPPVMVDANYFEQALHNLITNAADAMSVQPPEQRKLSFGISSIGSWIALSVTDTGPGISAQNLPHIFEPFFSSRPVAEHWGIGLTVTYRIIEAHKGRISVTSKEGKGTTFQILLPNLKNYIY